MKHQLVQEMNHKSYTNYITSFIIDVDLHTPTLVAIYVLCLFVVYQFFNTFGFRPLRSRVTGA